MQVEIINYGARIKAITIPIAGKNQNMIVSYDEVNDYIQDPYYLGATCGRVSNRISQATFTLNGRRYHLASNDGNNCLHGGIDNFSHRNWHIVASSISTNSLSLSLTSEDGDQGFPGELQIWVDYVLDDSNCLTIQYRGQTDKPTPINLTNHAYFNLGEVDGRLLKLRINAHSYLEKNNENLPTGAIIDTANSDFDFSLAKQILHQEQIAKDKSIINGQGYDHCFVLNTNALNDFAASLYSSRNNIRLDVFTNQPTVQFYNGKHLAGKFTSYQGICLEAQHHNDAVNQADFLSSILLAGQEYSRYIKYKFNYC